MGFVLVVFIVGGFYVFSYGLVKFSFFLLVGNLFSWDFKVLKKIFIVVGFWVFLFLVSFFIVGFFLLVGFEVKILIFKGLFFWLAIVLNIVVVGIVIFFFKFVFLKLIFVGKIYFLGLGLVLVVLFGGLVVGNVVYW